MPKPVAAESGQLNPLASAKRPPDRTVPDDATRGLSWRDSLGTVSAVATCFAVGTFLLSLLAADFWLAELFTHFRLQFLAVFAVLAGLLAVARYWRWLLLVALVAGFAAWPLVGDLLPRRQSAAHGSLKILAANVLFHNDQFAAFEQLVAGEQPDILVVIECTDAWRERLRGLESQYPYVLAEPRPHGFGIGLWSKHPLREAQAEMLCAADAPTLFATLDFAGQPLRIAAVHLLSPLDRVRFDQRNTQLANLSAAVIRGRGPQVVVGDFNATPWSPFLSRFLRETKLHDSRLGFGIQCSWPTHLPILRIPIDHLYVTPDLVVRERRLGPAIGSDHRPVIAVVGLRDP